MKPFQEYAVELFLQGETNKSQIARIVKEKFELEGDIETIRKSLNKLILRKTSKSLSDECDNKGIPIDQVPFYWVKTKDHSIFVRNNLDEQGTDLIDSIRDIVESHAKQPIKRFDRIKTDSPRAIKATVSDMHVGLEPNPNKNSLFSYEYNEEIFKENLQKVFNSIIKEYDNNGRFDLLVLCDLGDGLDGYDGLTTRGGHKLDQNMSNEQMFRVFVEGKLQLIENCIEAGIANKIIIKNVINDNHSGAFAHIANTTIRMILNRVYHKDDVEFDIMEKFMEHFTYGDHTFILTHGKDNKYMFKGLPLHLNDKAINFINDYIDHYNINTKYIHLEKGDLHQVAYARTKKFDYRNFMSFAPPSAWVSTNFGDCYSGYSIQSIPKYSGEITHSDFFFDLKKKL